MSITMNFKVSDLIEIIQKNHDEHKQIVDEANANYLLALKLELTNKLTALESGKKINPNSALTVPTSNLGEYESILAMLNMTTDKTISLEQTQVKCYVLDKWHWKSNFLMASSAYSDSARKSLAADS